MSQVQVRRRYIDCDQPSLYEDVVQTITVLQRLKREEPAFARHYEAWRDHREVTIETIDDLQKKIDIVCIGSNVVQCVGAAAGIVGLISGIAGLILEAKEDESAEDFKEFGKYCAGAGIATVASSSLLEAGLTQSAINQIKGVIDIDVELTEPLKKWIKFSKEVDHRLNRLFQCNIASTTFSNVIKVCGHSVQLLINGEAEIRDLMFQLQSCKMEGFGEISFEVMQKVVHFLKGIQRNPQLLQPVGEICRIFQETPHTFNFAKLGVMTSNFLESGTLTTMLSATGIGSTLLGHCALDTIAIASQVVTIILAIKNIKEGKSKYSEQLDQLKYDLRMELREITSRMNVSVRSSHLSYENILRIGY